MKTYWGFMFFLLKIPRRRTLLIFLRIWRLLPLINSQPLFKNSESNTPGKILKSRLTD